ncbi:hypothetical protein [Streptomyces sp. cg2]|uniref:hypothetical protein n=1 Tax=Streptomyces sp. cg2 TaxID=3238799 RepID=UPI0034E1FA31
MADHALMSEEAAAVLRDCGGWGRQGYEALGCPDQAIEAQALSRPTPDLAADWRERRARRIVALIEAYLVSLKPLTDSVSWEFES